MIKSNHAGNKPARRPHYATGRDRKLILARLREIDRMSAKELKALQSEASNMAAHFRHRQPPKTN